MQLLYGYPSRGHSTPPLFSVAAYESSSGCLTLASQHQLSLPLWLFLVCHPCPDLTPLGSSSYQSLCLHPCWKSPHRAHYAYKCLRPRTKKPKTRGIYDLPDEENLGRVAGHYFGRPGLNTSLRLWMPSFGNESWSFESFWTTLTRAAP
jgi:hypothetical protein